jgi:dethiobiotin synthetase
MKNIIVAGIGTDVGKTLVSAILTYALDAEYWKPIQCGPCTDRSTVETLLQGARKTHPEAAVLKAPRSPHHAAHLEGLTIAMEQIQPPKTKRPLVIEGCGGVFVPLSFSALTIDLFTKWECTWVVVSRHYLGSINHTLLTLEAMKKRHLPIQGIIFNGDPCPQTEEVILNFSHYPCIGRLYQEEQWTPQLIHAYAAEWKAQKAFQSAMLG